MKLIQESFKHAEQGFIINITTCNSRVAKAINTTTNEEVCFNRAKLEYMINKKVFVRLEK